MESPLGNGTRRTIPNFRAVPKIARAQASHAFPSTESIEKRQEPREAVDPLELFDANLDLVRRIAENSSSDPDASPAEAWQASNRKRRALLEALWDQQMRERFRRDAETFSFFDPSGEPTVTAPAGIEDAARFETLRHESGFSVDFSPDYGGFIGTLRGRDGMTPLAELPRPWLRDIADDPGRFRDRLRVIDDIRSDAETRSLGGPDYIGRRGRTLGGHDPAATAELFDRAPSFPVTDERRWHVGLKTPLDWVFGSILKPPGVMDADQFAMTLQEFLDPGPLGRFLLDVMPITSMSGANEAGYQDLGKAVDALLEGDMAGFALNGGLAFVDALGLIMGFSGPTNAVKRRVLAGLEDIKPWRRLESQSVLAKAKRAERRFQNELRQRRARREAEDLGSSQGARARASASPLKRLHEKGPPSAFQSAALDETFGDILPDMSREQQQLVRGLFGPILGTTTERYMVRHGRRAGYDVTEAGRGSPTATVVEVDGVDRKRIYDAVVERSGPSIRNGFLRLFEGGSSKLAIESKANRGRDIVQEQVDKSFSRNSKLADRAVTLRFSTKDIPTEEFKATAREMFAKHAGLGPRKLSLQQIEDLVDRLDRLRRQAGDWLTLDVLSGMAARSIARLLADRPADTPDPDAGQSSP